MTAIFDYIAIKIGDPVNGICKVVASAWSKSETQEDVEPSLQISFLVRESEIDDEYTQIIDRSILEIADWGIPLAESPELQIEIY